MIGYRIKSSGRRCTTLDELRRKLADVGLTLGSFTNGKAPVRDAMTGATVDCALEDRA